MSVFEYKIFNGKYTNNQTYRNICPALTSSSTQPNTVSEIAQATLPEFSMQTPMNYITIAHYEGGLQD